MMFAVSRLIWIEKVMWINRPLEVSQLGQLSHSSSRSRQMSSKLQLDVRHLNRWWHHLVNANEAKTQAWRKVMAAYRRVLLNKSLAG